MDPGIDPVRGLRRLLVVCVVCGWPKKIAKAEVGGMSHHDKPPYTPRGWHSELQPVVLDEAIKRAEATGRDAAVARAKREIDSKYGHEIIDRQNDNPRTQGHLRDNREAVSYTHLTLPTILLV